jgi:4-alpha-glucanotransferase
MEPGRELLERAAARWGIELEYADTWGVRHTATSRAIRAALAGLGVPCSTAAELEAAMRARDLAEWSRPFPPALVLYEDARTLELRVPEERSGASVKLEFEWENGDLEHHWFWLPELPETGHAKFDGRGFLAKRVPLATLRLGYHRLRVYWMREPELEMFGEARLIVCPRRVRTIDRRVAGVAISLYGLRSARNWGCGDFSDLRAAVDVFAEAGATFIALNPLHAIANREPYNTSPYLPECSLYRNFLYLDPERVPGFEASDAPETERAELRALEFVSYARVAALKLRALRRAFNRFQAAGGSDELTAFIESEGEPLEDYATYCALWSRIHQAHPEIWVWAEWPEPYRDPRSAEVAEFRREHSAEVRFHQFLQWQVSRQIAEVQDHALARGMKIGLYHDLALATDRHGADLWANRPFYVTGASLGAPPDELGPGGQDWGVLPPNREAHRANGYELFARAIRSSARHGGALRIDHVMRFFRLFWIPEGLTAAEGLYVRDYAEELLGIVALESARGGFIVIGEDLGTVAPEVRHRLDEEGILGYRLLWFEKRGDGSWRAPGEYPAHAAVSTTTHDLPTVAGFFLGRDIEARRSAGLLSEAEYQAQWTARHEDIRRIEESLAAAGFARDPLGFVLSTPCTLAIVNQEDLTGETEQQNLPATTWQHPNWCRKMRVAVEDLGPLARELRRRLEKAGRL